MGICLSAMMKPQTPSHSGNLLKGISGDENNLGGSSRKISSVSEPPSPLYSEGSLDLKSFDYDDLKIATKNFRPDSVLEKAGSGSISVGWVDENSYTASKPGSGLVIAVKRLSHDVIKSPQEWLVEVNYLSQVCHPNLIKLVGYCIEDDARFLVYEFTARGSLENHLFTRGTYFQPLCWSLRLKVALGAAKGLRFIHRPDTKVIYWDFKTSIILLDMNYNAKLSEFVLAEGGPTKLDGTYGYSAPEQLATGRSNTKSDVYSFGVVLLEILSGKRVIDKNRPSGEHNLVEWAKPYLANKSKLSRVLDNRLEGQYSLDVAHTIANLALKCLSTDPKLRPTMNEIVEEFEKLKECKDAVNVRSNSSDGPRPRRRSGHDLGSVIVV